jgi:hypothetical protein
VPAQGELQRPQAPRQARSPRQHEQVGGRPQERLSEAGRTSECKSAAT